MSLINRRFAGRWKLALFSGAVIAAGLAIALPAGCVIGWLGGSWLDRHFHQTWISIVGILLGAAAGFVQIFATVSRYLKNDRS